MDIWLRISFTPRSGTFISLSDAVLDYFFPPTPPPVNKYRSQVMGLE